jgi:hypothetical protein
MEWNKDKTNSRRDINYLKWHFLRSEEDLKRRNFDLTSYNNCFKPHNVTYNKPFYFFKVGEGARVSLFYSRHVGSCELVIYRR